MALPLQGGGDVAISATRGGPTEEIGRRGVRSRQWGGEDNGRARLAARFRFFRILSFPHAFLSLFSCCASSLQTNVVPWSVPLYPLSEFAPPRLREGFPVFVRARGGRNSIVDWISRKTPRRAGAIRLNGLTCRRGFCFATTRIAFGDVSVTATG